MAKSCQSTFKGTVALEDRSKMNICFVTDNEVLENEFATDAKMRLYQSERSSICR
ncbi:MAG: hypothetical protein IPF93_08230, partial [Saprospiraceae bacterium]|nr:hypothetical protein [Saprospiraceae bacterium]